MAAMPSTVRSRPSSRNLAFDVLRVAAIVGVVVIHTTGAMVSNAEIRGSWQWQVAVVLDYGFVWAVPVFVMISGALVLHPRQLVGGVGEFYRRRAWRILPALVAWHVIYYVAHHVLIRGEPLSAGRLLMMSYGLQVEPHLYFLWLILGLYVLTPVMGTFLHVGGQRRAFWSAGVALAWGFAPFVVARALTEAGQPTVVPLNALNHALPYVGYFLAGWALRDVRLRGRALALTAAATTLLLVGTVAQALTMPNPLWLRVLSPVGTLSPVVALLAVGIYVVAVSVWSNRREGVGARALRELSDAAFGVYLVHFLPLIVINTAVPGTEGSLAATTAKGVTILVTSFVLAALLRRVPYVRAIV